MKKRSGVHVIAITMLILGFIVFLLGVLPPILLATRATGSSWQALLALPTVLIGCSGALFLLGFGSLLLTLVKISENAAAAAVARSSKLGAGSVPVTAALEAAGPGLQAGEGHPEAEAGLVAAVAVAGTEAMAAPAQAAETAAVMPEAVPAAVAVGVTAAEAAGPEVPQSQKLGRDLGEGGTAPVEMAPPWEEEVKAEEVSGPVEEAPTLAAPEVASEAVPAAPVAAVVKTPQEEVDELRAQLAALEAQLAELKEYPAGPDESFPLVETEELPLDAGVPPKLPGSEEVARIAAEMASLQPGPADNTPGKE